jgi:hypothetical protein
MRTRVPLVLLTIAAVLALASIANGAAPKKPYQSNAKTCSTYASPAFVKAVTGFDGTAQKGPNGQCHFIVNGQKDAFQIGIFTLKSPAAAKALLKQGWGVLVQQAAQAQGSCTDPADPVCSQPSQVSGIGDGAEAADTGPTGFAWFWVIRGPLYLSIQSSGSAYVPLAKEQAIAKRLLATIPR